jgi:hypothetical protein
MTPLEHAERLSSALTALSISLDILSRLPADRDATPQLIHDQGRLCMARLDYLRSILADLRADLES